MGEVAVSAAESAYDLVADLVSAFAFFVPPIQTGCGASTAACGCVGWHLSGGCPRPAPPPCPQEEEQQARTQGKGSGGATETLYLASDAVLYQASQHSAVGQEEQRRRR